MAGAAMTPLCCLLVVLGLVAVRGSRVADDALSGVLAAANASRARARGPLEEQLEGMTLEEKCARVLLAIAESKDSAKVLVLKSAITVATMGASDAVGQGVVTMCNKGTGQVVTAMVTPGAAIVGKDQAKKVREAPVEGAVAVRFDGDGNPKDPSQVKQAAQAVQTGATYFGIGTLCVVTAAFLAPLTMGGSLAVAAGAAAGTAGTIAANGGAMVAVGGLAATVVELGIDGVDVHTMGAWYEAHCAGLVTIKACGEQVEEAMQAALQSEE